MFWFLQTFIFIPFKERRHCSAGGILTKTKGDDGDASNTNAKKRIQVQENNPGRNRNTPNY